ncbi:MAG: MFS transporter [Pseudomonadota bacterium]
MPSLFAAAAGSGTARNIGLYPWLRFFQNLLFWQSVWFLYFQAELSAAEAILLYAVFDIGTTVLEVPSGWMSDRVGRRLTLTASAVAGLSGALLLSIGDSFATFALAQVLFGASIAFASGTDSALLYESLMAEGREAEVEANELRAWRSGFAALAVSAVVGGLMALWSPVLPFLASAVAFAGMLIVALNLAEPPKRSRAGQSGGELARLASLGSAFREPVLRWLFALSVVLYSFDHIAFVFGQPFIETALAGTGWRVSTWDLSAAVSGAVTTVMMLCSLLASLIAPRLRHRLGLASIVLIAMGMHLALTGLLAFTNEIAAIALLFLRKVPDALSRPFILARIQPILSSDSRATYLSLQSLTSKLVFSGSLILASTTSSGVGAMPFDELQAVLGAYALTGLVAFCTLIVTAQRLAIDPAPLNRPAGRRGSGPI